MGNCNIGAVVLLVFTDELKRKLIISYVPELGEIGVRHHEEVAHVAIAVGPHVPTQFQSLREEFCIDNT